jgi:hypothetical protein
MGILYHTFLWLSWVTPTSSLSWPMVHTSSELAAGCQLRQKHHTPPWPGGRSQWGWGLTQASHTTHALILSPPPHKGRREKHAHTLGHRPELLGSPCSHNAHSS